MMIRSCPHCLSVSVRRSRHCGFIESVVLPFTLQRPYRCLYCHARFNASFLRRRQSQAQRVRVKPPFYVPLWARILTVAVAALLLPTLLAMAKPAGAFVRHEVAVRWNQLLGKIVKTAAAAIPAATATSSVAPLRVANYNSTPTLPRFVSASYAEASNSAAAPQEAKVALGRMESSGAVQVNDAPVANDTTLFEGDVVRTGGDGFARLDVKNRGTISIFPNTKLSFTGTWRHFASLQGGKISFLAFPAASKFQINVGYYVLTPSADTSSAAEVEMAADGSAVVRATQGNIGVIALEGPTALFLNAGEGARLSASGDASTVQPQNAQTAKAAPGTKQPPPKSEPQTQPSGTTQPTVGKSGSHPGVIVGIAVAAGAGAAFALAKGKSSSNTAVSPSTP